MSQIADSAAVDRRYHAHIRVSVALARGETVCEVGA